MLKINIKINKVKKKVYNILNIMNQFLMPQIQFRMVLIFVNVNRNILKLSYFFRNQLFKNP